MTEISDLSETDSANTSISGYSLDGSIANMSTTDDSFRATMGMLKRWFKSSLFRLRDGTDQTKLLAFGLSGITTGTTRTATVPNHDLVVSGWKPGAAIASATSLVLGTDGNYFSVTGTTTITGISASGVTVGTRVLLEFAGAVTLTHGANLVLPESAAFTTAAGDRGVFVKTSTGNVWLCESFTRATNPADAIVSLSGASLADIAIPDWANVVLLGFYDVSPSGTAAISVFLGDSGGYESSGYLGTLSADGTRSALSSQFSVTPSVGPPSSVFGTMMLLRMSATVWVCTSQVGFANTSSFVEVAGGKGTSAATTGIRVAVSSGTFDAGSMRAFFLR